MIASGQCRPGAKLVQQELARQLGVSRAVVREAIFELLGLGLVETTDNHGATVGEFHMERLLECYELRELFEGLAARRCCDRITVRQLRDLREMADEIYRLRGEGQHEPSGRLDRDFHFRLTQISGGYMLKRLSNTYAVLGKVVTPRTGDAERPLAEHQMILNDIQSGRPDAAEKSAREHVRRAKAFVQRYYSDQPSELEWLV